MYNHKNQYRCTIIRGKSQSNMDNMLPAYANLVNDICPCGIVEFKSIFNKQLSHFISGASLKTLNNHRTEIAGKLFGLYHASSKGVVYPSERALKYLEDNDQPAFFKDICFKFQFPNGMDIISKISDRITHGVCIRPFPYLIKMLLVANSNTITLSLKEIAYYVLNSLDVLRGEAEPAEIIDTIISDRRKDIRRRIEPCQASSYNYQHIKEQVNLLELANLVITDSSGLVRLNNLESAVIEHFAVFWNKKPEFSIWKYNLQNPEDVKALYFDWSDYYGRISKNTDIFRTRASSLGITPKMIQDDQGDPNVNIGDEGEKFVFEYEKERVINYNRRLANKVLHLGGTKGLGYDIQSVVAERGPNEEFVKYIEVKSTKRVTEPDCNDEDWQDTFNLTRNEWVAAQQHKDIYSIVRVYFVRDKIIMYFINNIFDKSVQNKVNVVPLTFRVDFTGHCVDYIHTKENDEEI